MSPVIYIPGQGFPLPNNGTAYGNECCVCYARFTTMYIVGGLRYCGAHVPRPTVPPGKL